MSVWMVAAIVACTGLSSDEPENTGDSEAPAPAPKKPTETGDPPPVPIPKPTAETGTPPVDPNLRPPVQTGSANADWQTPAFPEQTRAPQPAEATDFDVQTITSSLNRPWGFEILPDGRFLVNQKLGSMVIVATDGTVSAPISGVPAVDASGQGGLLDVALDPDFANNRRVYWTYSDPDGFGARTSVGRGVLSAGDDQLTGVTRIFFQEPTINSSGHYGSRIAFAPDGNLFVTLGDRQLGSGSPHPQDATNTVGAVVRITTDGAAAPGNPNVGNPSADDRLWSYGHRNPQSAVVDLQGRLWTVEHGPQGGDELNRPVDGKNYGWPEVSYGEEYGGAVINDGLTARADVEQPVYYWDPVIAPAGMAVYDGTLFDGFQGDLLIGGLQARGVVRLSLRNDQVYTEEWLDLGTRCRDVRVGTDGAIYVATDDGDLLRLVPSPK